MNNRGTLFDCINQTYRMTTATELHDDHGLDFAEDGERGAYLALAEEGSRTYVRVFHLDGSATYYVEDVDHIDALGNHVYYSFTFGAPEEHTNT